MQMSPYKFDHGCTIQKPDWVHVAPCPDVYRGQYRVNDEELFDEKKLTAVGKHYSSDVRQIIEQARLHGRSVGAFIAEALQSCGGQIIPPPEYFDDVAKYVRDHGGVVIIDEVQTGFGRVGSTFWAYQLFSKNFVPDIVTMGKPMGNGFPVAAVVTRKEIADKLGGDVGYFNTYGGNPVACTAVIAVLDVIDSESLSEHSQRMGHIFKKELEELKQKHTSIGDIRGVGLFWGIDLVDDRKTRMPATKLANEVINMLRNDYGVLLSTDGPYANILKIKPPMCFNEDNLHKTVDAIDKCLRQLQK
ncbi:hypothetical protein AB6A40_007060 [Gnathostoma spinigerum]|uniref:Uncharacterized protein n=1 Tax=Gnathostoma spinigerum TaxID=75299 RepID=A0ABD6ESB7_9BILA